MLLGKGGADTLRGDEGMDKLYGNGGPDNLISGGTFKDVLDCGPRGDKARVDAQDEVVNCEDVTVVTQ